jgi:hypothetical protein
MIAIQLCFSVFGGLYDKTSKEALKRKKVEDQKRKSVYAATQYTPPARSSSVPARGRGGGSRSYPKTMWEGDIAMVKNVSKSTRSVLLLEARTISGRGVAVEAVARDGVLGSGVATLSHTQVIEKVGGRLKYFTNNWTSLGVDKWVTDKISRGYLLEFTEKTPTVLVIKETVMPKESTLKQTLLQEVEDLLEKGAIYPVHPPKWGFGRHFF